MTVPPPGAAAPGGPPLLYGIDVSLTHPVRGDGLAPSVGSVTTPTAGAAAHRREEVKDAKYLYLCRLRDFLFVPFVVETGGRLGERAIEFMRVVADHAAERMRLRRRLTHRDVRRISATLYRRGTQAVSVARVRSVGARLRGADVQSAGASPQGSSSRREAAATRDYGGWRLIQGLDGGAPQ